MKKAIVVRNDSEQMAHIITIIERFGDRARYKYDNDWYVIINAKPEREGYTKIFMESIL